MGDRDKFETRLESAVHFKKLQLDCETVRTAGGSLSKCYVGNRYFYYYVSDCFTEDIDINLIVYYHGSRDIAINCALNSTNLIDTFGSSNWIVVFGQADCEIKDPYIHPNYNHIAYGEIYWGINLCQNMLDDVSYTKQIINSLEAKYPKINRKVMMGHSNGGVFALLIPIYLPNMFDTIISHQGGLGFDPLFRLDFELVNVNDNKPKILIYTGEFDVHKSVCEQAQQIFSNEGYDAELICVPGLYHGRDKECEQYILQWLMKSI